MNDRQKNIDQKRSASAIDRVRNLIGTERVSKADRIAAIYARYLPLDRDERLQEALLACITSVTTPVTGRPDKRRIVVISGRSGAGKTTALAKHVANIPAMQSYTDEDGVIIHPTIQIDCPSPCTPRLLAIAGLEALGHTPPDRIRENEAWILFRRLLKVHKVMFVIIDEAQNSIESANVTQATIIGDAFKSLTQMPEWPVRLILAGVSPLASFMARKQLYNRRIVVSFDTLDAEGNTDLIRHVLETVVEQHAQLQLNIDLDGDFLLRLMHACDAEFGSIVQLIRAAVEVAIMAERSQVDLGDFVRTYASFSGCRPSKNVFTADNWSELDPTLALHREEDRQWEEERKRRKGKSVTKYGVRPQ